MSSPTLTPLGLDATGTTLSPVGFSGSVVLPTVTSTTNSFLAGVELQDIYIGSTSVQVYVGATKIWDKS
jgi:hypothetical protein